MMNRITIAILIFLVSICIICTHNYNFITDQGNEIFKLILEGSISGIVSLGGLLFTFFKQEELSRCPCLIFEQATRVCNARESYSNIDKRHCIDCCSGNVTYVRKVPIKIHNIKNAWAINITICNLSQGALKGSDEIEKVLILPSNDINGVNGEIRISFQDSFGKKYRQIIKYSQIESDYFFESSLPTEGV